MHPALICPDYTLSTNIFPMVMDYAISVYNRIPDMQFGLSAIEIWSRSRIEPVSENLSNCHVWCYQTYVLEPYFQNSGLKIPKWNPKIQREVNMGFITMHSIQVVLILNLLIDSLSPRYHVVFDDMFTTVLISTEPD